MHPHQLFRHLSPPFFLHSPFVYGNSCKNTTISDMICAINCNPNRDIPKNTTISDMIRAINCTPNRAIPKRNPFQRKLITKYLEASSNFLLSQRMLPVLAGIKDPEKCNISSLKLQKVDRYSTQQLVTI